jgi:zinc protease
MRLGLLSVGLGIAACGSDPPQRPAVAPTEKASPEEPFRAQPPPLGPEPEAAATSIDRWKLKNGVEILFVPRPGIPIVTVRVTSRVGAGAARTRPAVVGIMNESLDKGTRSRSVEAIAGPAGSNGASITAATSWDHSELTLTVDSRRLDPVLRIVGDVVVNPTFPAPAIARLVQDRRSTIAGTRNVPPQMIGNAVAAVLYGREHPYGQPLLGRESDLAAVDRAEVVKVHREVWSAENVAVSIAGDVTKERIAPSLEGSFGGIPAAGKPGAPTRVAEPPRTAAEPARLVVLDRPGTKRVNVAFADFGAAHGSPDREALLVLNDVLGSMASSRMNSDLRVAHAYTYGVTSFFDLRQAPGPMIVISEVAANDAAAAIARMLGVLDRVAKEGISETELDLAKRHRVALILSAYETTSEVTRALADVFVYDLLPDDRLRRIAAIRALTLADVKQAAAKYIRPEAMKVLVAGDWRAIGPSLSALKLGSPSFRDPFGDSIVAPPP